MKMEGGAQAIQFGELLDAGKGKEMASQCLQRDHPCLPIPHHPGESAGSDL